MTARALHNLHVLASNAVIQPTPSTVPNTPITTNSESGGGPKSAQGRDKNDGRGTVGGRGRGNSNGENASSNNSNQVQARNPITFEGDNMDVSIVLGLRIEKFHKKTTFIIFKENAYTYIISNYKDGHDL